MTIDALDALANEPQFLDHLAPVWNALPDVSRGTFMVEPKLVRRAEQLGIAAVPTPRPPRVPAYPPPRTDGPPLLVASYGDIKVGRRLGFGPFAFIEHGAGQSYAGDPRWVNQLISGSYPGGPDRADVELFMVPNGHSADRWRAAYPEARVELVGSPRLDTLPARDYSIGLECDPWTDLLAAIRADPADTGICVAHAIADVSVTELGRSGRPGIEGRPNTTASDISASAPMLPSVLRDRDRQATAALMSGMSKCTSASRSSCPLSATSAEPPSDLRWLSDGTLRRMFGESIPPGVHSLQIPTTTFGSVNLAIPCTTAKATSPATPITRGAGRPNATVCVSFHFQAPMSLPPEAQTAIGEYRPLLGDLAARFTTIGHAHPKADWPATMERIYRRAGIPFVASFDDVCRQADVYVCDNSSTIFEFASTGRPVVVLNSKFYRRNIEHGLRYWSAATVGLQVDRPEDLLATIERALEDPIDQQRARAAALDIVYQPRTNGAAYAATAIQDWLASRQVRAA